MLKELDRLPDGLLLLEANQLASALGGPTLIHLQGRQSPALFVSILMHGNETTGWEAVRQLLQQLVTWTRRLKGCVDWTGSQIIIGFGQVVMTVIPPRPS